MTSPFDESKDVDIMGPSQIQTEIEEKYGIPGMTERSALFFSKLMREGEKQKETERIRQADLAREEAQLEKETEKLENVVLTSFIMGTFIVLALGYIFILGLLSLLETMVVGDVTFWSFMQHHWVAIGIALASFVVAVPLLLSDQIPIAMAVTGIGILISILMIVVQIYNLQDEQIEQRKQKTKTQPPPEEQDNTDVTDQ